MTARMPALLRAAHPLPTVAVTVVAIVLSVSAGLGVWRTVLVGLVILANQLSIGLSNDWLDAGRDRETARSDKPVARGELALGTARGVAIACAVASVALSIPLGWWAVAAHAVFLASGWAYNAGLKSTVFSVVPYFTGFASLPLFVSLSAEQPVFASPWVVLAGGLLGIAAHSANVLPDLDDDRATGVRGFPHRIGVKATGVLIAAGLAGASASVVFGAGLTGWVPVAGFVASLGVAVACVWLVWRHPESRVVFRLIMVDALIVVALLAAAGPVA
jgi:4-hydroxybenzoate polyprenyltransferase